MIYLQLLLVLALSFRARGSRLLLLLLQRQRGVVGLLQRILIPARPHCTLRRCSPALISSFRSLRQCPQQRPYPQQCQLCRSHACCACIAVTQALHSPALVQMRERMPGLLGGCILLAPLQRGLCNRAALRPGPVICRGAGSCSGSRLGLQEAEVRHLLLFPLSQRLLLLRSQGSELSTSWANLPAKSDHTREVMCA